MFNRTKLEKLREDFIKELLTDPKKFASVVYSRRGTKYYSPYIYLNDQNLCCLINAIPAEGQQILPTIDCGEVGRIRLRRDSKGELHNPYSFGVTDKTPRASEILSFKVNKLEGLGILDQVRVKYTETAPYKLIQEVKEESGCSFPDLENYAFLGMDNFTTEIVIAYFLGIADKLESRTNNITNYFSSTICNREGKNYGLTLTENITSLNLLPRNSEYTSETTLSKEVQGEIKVIKPRLIKQETVKNLFLQLIAILDILQSEYDFVHGKLDGGALFFSDEASLYKHKDLLVAGTPLLKLGDFKYSSMSVYSTALRKNIRLYNRNVLAERFNKLGFKPRIMQQFNGKYYKLSSFNNINFARHRHMGLPYYFSLDFYTGILAMLMIPEIHYKVFSSEPLRIMIWDDLFFDEDSSKVYIRLREAVRRGVPNTIENIYRIIGNSKLKCDILRQKISTSTTF